MPVTADTTMIALALATGRSLARRTGELKGIGNGGRRAGVLTLLEEALPAFDDALAALKRIEAAPEFGRVPLLMDGKVVGEVDPEVAIRLSAPPGPYSMEFTPRG